MNLNCKPGDMAIIIGANYSTEHIGKIVTVVELFGGDAWICEPDLSAADGTKCAWYDYNLRPIRPSSEQDEMLRLVGLPEKENI